MILLTCIHTKGLEITSPPIGRDTVSDEAIQYAAGLEITSPPIGRDTNKLNQKMIDIRLEITSPPIGRDTRLYLLVSVKKQQSRNNLPTDW